MEKRLRFPVRFGSVSAGALNKRGAWGAGAHGCGRRSSEVVHARHEAEKAARMGHGGRFIFTLRASRRAEEAASTVRGSPERNRKRPGYLEMCVNRLLKRPRYFKRLVTHRNGFGNVLYQWFETSEMFSNG